MKKILLIFAVLLILSLAHAKSVEENKSEGRNKAQIQVPSTTNADEKKNKAMEEYCEMFSVEECKNYEKDDKCTKLHFDTCMTIEKKWFEKVIQECSCEKMECDQKDQRRCEKKLAKCQRKCIKGACNERATEECVGEENSKRCKKIIRKACQKAHLPKENKHKGNKNGSNKHNAHHKSGNKHHKAENKDKNNEEKQDNKKHQEKINIEKPKVDHQQPQVLSASTAVEIHQGGDNDHPHHPHPNTNQEDNSNNREMRGIKRLCKRKAKRLCKKDKQCVIDHRKSCETQELEWRSTTLAQCACESKPCADKKKRCEKRIVKCQRKCIKKACKARSLDECKDQSNKRCAKKFKKACKRAHHIRRQKMRPHHKGSHHQSSPHHKPSDDVTTNTISAQPDHQGSTQSTPDVANDANDHKSVASRLIKRLCKKKANRQCKKDKQCVLQHRQSCESDEMQWRSTTLAQCACDDSNKKQSSRDSKKIKASHHKNKHHGKFLSRCQRKCLKKACKARTFDECSTDSSKKCLRKARKLCKRAHLGFMRHHGKHHSMHKAHHHKKNKKHNKKEKKNKKENKKNKKNKKHNKKGKDLKKKDKKNKKNKKHDKKNKKINKNGKNSNVDSKIPSDIKPDDVIQHNSQNMRGVKRLCKKLAKKHCKKDQQCRLSQRKSCESKELEWRSSALAQCACDAKACTDKNNERCKRKAIKCQRKCIKKACKARSADYCKDSNKRKCTKKANRLCRMAHFPRGDNRKQAKSFVGSFIRKILLKN